MPTLPTATFGVMTDDVSLAAGASCWSTGSEVSMLLCGKYVVVAPAPLTGRLVSAE